MLFYVFHVFASRGGGRRGAASLEAEPAAHEQASSPGQEHPESLCVFICFDIFRRLRMISHVFHMFFMCFQAVDDFKCFSLFLHRCLQAVAGEGGEQHLQKPSKQATSKPATQARSIPRVCVCSYVFLFFAGCDDFECFPYVFHVFCKPLMISHAFLCFSYVFASRGGGRRGAASLEAEPAAHEQASSPGQEHPESLCVFICFRIFRRLRMISHAFYMFSCVLQALDDFTCFSMF